MLAKAEGRLCVFLNTEHEHQEYGCPRDPGLVQYIRGQIQTDGVDGPRTASECQYGVIG